MNRNPNGCILYVGPSRFDGQMIVVIVTGLTDSSENVKTGVMLQTWILRVDRKPTRARKDGADYSVCFDCPHRTGSCYVNLGQGPRAIWESFTNGRGYAVYDPDLHDRYFTGRNVRLGSYGDPAAVPIEVFEPVLRLCAGHTGYTHQWDKPVGADYRETCMASVDNADQADRAASEGWRYFLVIGSDYAKRAGEINCGASAEQGKRTTCDKCKLCNGASRSKGPNVFINVHGNKAIKSIYYNRTFPLVPVNA